MVDHWYDFCKKKRWNTTTDAPPNWKKNIIVVVDVHDLIGWFVDIGFWFCVGTLGIGFGGKDDGGGKRGKKKFKYTLFKKLTNVCNLLELVSYGLGLFFA